MNKKSIFKILVLLIAFLILTGCNVANTYLTHDVNNFETGKTISKEEVDFSTSLNSTHTIKMSSDYTTSEENVEINSSYDQFRDIGSSNAIIYGLTNRLNLKINILLSPSGIGIGPSLKYRFTPDDSNFAASISSNFSLLGGASETLNSSSHVPELFPGSGTEGDYNSRFKVSSKGKSFGLKLPMSYSFTKDNDLMFGLQASWLEYSSEADYSSTFDGTDGQNDEFTHNETNNENYFYPGFSVGMRVKSFFFSTTFIHYEDSLKPYIGIAFKK